MPELRKIDGEAIFRELREEILTGVHAPGTPFREIPLSERFGVSRTPIRAVLSRLEQEGLLARVDRGLRVPEADPERVIQVYDLRIQLEGTAAAEAARAHQLSDLLKLEALLARDRSLENPGEQQRISTNLEFHEAIWQATHNPVLIDLLSRLNTHLVHYPTSTLSVGDRWERALDEHEAILKAIEDRDEQQASHLLREHMKDAKRTRLQLLREHAINQL